MQDKSNTLHGYILKPNFVEIHCAQWLIVSERRKFGLTASRAQGPSRGPIGTLLAAEDIRDRGAGRGESSFVVGTGGANLYSTYIKHPLSELFANTSGGFLKLTLWGEVNCIR
jgi:hypothetical protein